MTDDRERLKEMVSKIIDKTDISIVKLISVFMSGMILLSLWDANNITEPTETRTDVEDVLVKLLVKIITKGGN